MKLAFVNSSYPAMPCGVGDYAASLAEAAEALGHSVVVFTSRDTRVRVPQRPSVRPVFRDWTIGQFFAHVREIRRERPDAVVLQYPSLLPGPHSRLMFLLPLLARVFFASSRVVLVVHEFAHTHEAAQRQLGVSFRFAHEIVAVNPADMQAICERYPGARKKARLVGIGSSIPRVPIGPERRAELRAALIPGSGSEGPVVFFFGLLHGPEKGFEELLEALAGRDSRVMLAVSGSLDEGNPYHRVVAERIRTLGLEDRVRWLGFLEPTRVSEWIQAADIVALPFWGGAAGNRSTLAAVLLNGAAVVTTRGAEVPDYLHDGENAALVPSRDPAALAEALERLLSSSAERGRLRDGAEQLAQRFEWPAVAEETLGAARRPPEGDWPADGLERVSACPACGDSARWPLHGALRDRVSFVAPGEWALHACARCGAGYLDPRPTEDTIGLAYRSYHTHGQPGPPHTAPPGRLGNFRWALSNGYLNSRYGYEFAPAIAFGARVAAVLPRRRWLADMRVRHLAKPSGSARLLDVGCGNGTFLRDMRAAGWEVWGIDPDPEAVATARTTGAPVEQGLLTDDTFRHEKFDAITLSHVVEHLPNPPATLEICRRLLKPGGVLWIATPNLESIGYRRFGASWRGLEPPRHLTIFTRLALTGLLEQLGFEIVSAPRNYMAEFFFQTSSAIARGDDPESPPSPAPPSVERSGRVADMRTLWRARNAEELMVLARRPLGA